MLDAIKKRYVVGLPSTHLLGLFMVLAGTFLMSTKAIIIQWLFALGVHVNQVVLLRMAFAFPLYLLMGYMALRRMQRSGRALPTCRQIIGIMIAGFLCYHVSSYLDIWALQTITAGLERTILFSYPLMIAVFEHCRGDKLSKRQWGSLLLAYFGVFLFYYEDHRIYGQEIIGGVLAVFGAAVLAAYFVIASRHYTRKIDSDLFTAVAMGITVLTFTVHVGVFSPAVEWVMSPAILAFTFVLASCCSVLAAFLFNRGIAASGAMYGTVAGMIGPLITVALSAWFFDHAVTDRHVLALFLVIFGVVGVQYLGRQRHLV